MEAEPEKGFLGGSVVKNPPANAGETASMPGSGKSSGEGNGNPFQYSCVENSMDRGAWWAAVRGVKKSQTRLSMHAQSVDLFNLFYQKKVHIRSQSKIGYGCSNFD